MPRHEHTPCNQHVSSTCRILLLHADIAFTRVNLPSTPMNCRRNVQSTSSPIPRKRIMSPLSSQPPSDSELNHEYPWHFLLNLLAHLLDPKTIALSSCVCKYWRSTLSQDYIWKPLCLRHHPSSSAAFNAVSSHRLFALLHTTAARPRRCLRTPRIGLHNLIFAVDVFYECGAPAFSVVKRGGDVAELQCDRVFRFDVGLEGCSRPAGVGKGVRVVWNLVTEGWGAGVLMVDGVGREGAGGEVWVSEELPVAAPGRGRCCGGKCVVAELGLGLERVRFGLMSAREWRYLSVDDGLLYLEPFLLDSG